MMGQGIGVTLITAAVGYWVLVTSEKEKGQVKKTGQILALIIILISLAGAACRVIGFARAKGYCPGGKMACPFVGKPMGSSQPAQ